MNTVDYIVKKFNLDLTKRSPFKLSETRTDVLPELFADLGFKIGVEVGVWRGVFSKVLCDAVPDLKLYGVDPWALYPTWNNYRGITSLTRSYKKTVELMKPYKNYRIIRKFSMDAVKDFDDQSLDFVFIDGDHRLQFVINDIAEWSRKVKVGGLVCGHDYGTGKNGRFDQVKLAIDSWGHANHIHPLVVFGHWKENGWFWVKKKLYDEEYKEVQ